MENNGVAVGDGIYKRVCSQCGAKREDKQIGLEDTPESYVENLVSVFREVWRVLKDDGTLWLNLGDTYNGNKVGKTNNKVNQAINDQDFVKRSAPGIKPKDLIGIPWRVAFALQADGWHLRQDIIWSKPNVMPESVKDRCTKSHEYLFLLTKRPCYYFDSEAIREPNVNPTRTNYTPGKSSYVEGNTGHIPGNRTRRNDGFEKYANGATYDGRNKRSVWTVSTKPYKGAHFATFPEELITPCILAGSRELDTVLDPFGGSGTVAQVAWKHNRRSIMIELNPDYLPLIKRRLANQRNQRPLVF